MYISPYIYIYLYYKSLHEKRLHASRAAPRAVTSVTHLGPRRLNGAASEVCLHEFTPRIRATTQLGTNQLGASRIGRYECPTHKRPSTDRNARSQALSPGLWCHRRRNRGVGKCTSVLGRAGTRWCGHKAGGCVALVG